VRVCGEARARMANDMMAEVDDQRRLTREHRRLPHHIVASCGKAANLCHESSLWNVFFPLVDGTGLVSL